MQLATGGNMLNFGYWSKEDTSPISAQNRLCDKVGKIAELDSANSLLDVGSGLSSPAIMWSMLYPNIDISCVNINYIQLQLAKKIVKEKTLNSTIHEINSTSTVLPFSTNSMERVIALESAQHFKPFSSFISESYRVLKKDGYFLFCDFRTADGLQELYDQFSSSELKFLNRIDITDNIITRICLL